MNPNENEESKNFFFADYAYYDSKKEKEEVKNYLTLWKKYQIEKLGNDYFYEGEQWIDRPLEPGLTARSTLALKIKMRKK